jgi:uncharacterized protein YciI
MNQTFAILAWDSEQGAAKRAEHRAAHFAHIETVMEKIALAGPLKDDDGNFVGSMVVAHVPNRDAAEALLRSDPYFAGGVWEKWEIFPFLAAAGQWVGRKTW